jgi:hypothetical protein
MVLIFELIFECFIKRLLCSPEEFLLVPSRNPKLLMYNCKHVASVLFVLFEDWIVKNTVLDKRSVKRPLPRLTFDLLGRTESRKTRTSKSL